ncbi:MAG: hypothetical protein IJY04_02580, partial [Clostridia bacterium]|nr:hypothetical protein [Clostridia bacterium]
ELTPAEKPIYQMPSSDEIGTAFNKADGSFTVEFTPETNPKDAEFSWPFVIDTKKFGEPCIKPSNYTRHSSYATMYANVHLNAGDVVAFDYFSSTEQGADILYVLVDRDDIYQISGESNEWKSCYTYVALEEGDYEIAFIYLKESSDHIGEDTVYLDNFRIVSVDDIDVASYIPRFCATGVPEDGFGFLNYSSVGLASDGYYHVDTNGDGSFDVGEPLLLADLMNFSRFSPSTSIYTLAYNGDITLDGKDYYEDLLPFFSYASNSEISGFCTVNEELADLLRIVAAAVGVEGHDNEWLQMCQYYDAYPTGAQLADPIRGLASFSAFETVVGTVGDNE